MGELMSVRGLISDVAPEAGVDATLFEEATIHFPFSFALVDRPTGRSFCLSLGDDRNGMAVVETDIDAAIEWGTELYKRVLEDARSVPVRAPKTTDAARPRRHYFDWARKSRRSSRA